MIGIPSGSDGSGLERPAARAVATHVIECLAEEGVCDEAATVVITSTCHMWVLGGFSMCGLSATSTGYQPLSYQLRHMSI